MLKSLRRILGHLLLLAGLLAGSAVPAHAAGPTGSGNICAVSTICLVVVQPGTAPSPGGSGGSGSGSTASCVWNGVSYPCWDPEKGWFDVTDGCYLSLMDPQPTAGDPYWGGHDPSTGSVYLKTCYSTVITTPQPVFLSKSPSLGAPPPDPAMVAQMAFNKLVLVKPVPHTAPTGSALVGSPVWFWFDTSSDTSAETLGPQSKTAVLGPLAMTAQATLSDVSWDLGYKDQDGKEVTFSCKGNGGAGLPYQAGLETSPPPGACTWLFSKTSKITSTPTAAPTGSVPGAVAKPYDVTVTRVWKVNITGSGVDEWLTVSVPSDPVRLTVSDLQVLN